MTGWCPQCGNYPDDPCRSCRRAGHLPEYVPPLDIKRHDFLGLGGVPAGDEGVLPAQTAPGTPQGAGASDPR